LTSIDAMLLRIGPLDAETVLRVRKRQDQLAKPRGSLGRLEELAARLAGITGQALPRFPKKAVIVLAADHGVTAEGVSAYPAEVTPQMVENFLAGRAAINILGRRVGSRVVVGDLGVAADLPPHPQLIDRKVRRGTRNMAVGPALERHEAQRAIEAGIEIFEAEREAGLDLVATGDMGIGNTTASSAIIAAISRRPPVEVTGRGTGLDEAGWRHKVAIVEQALEVNRPDPTDPIDVLAKVGGLEIAGLVGVILAGAAHRVPVVLDGFIAGAAALIATELCPGARDYLIAAHGSAEIGHRVVLERMELAPLLNLDLRLGEGTGAAMAMHLIDDAVALLAEMPTFAEARVSERNSASNDTSEPEARLERTAGTSRQQ
jgi:nicotinate-nucleotide--dimethylbenzimidazole phosphoribosyltransferase